MRRSVCQKSLLLFARFINAAFFVKITTRLFQPGGFVIITLSKCVGLADECGQVNVLSRIVGNGIIGLLLEVAVHGKSCAGRDKLADDDVFLQADKVIDLCP